MLLAFLLLVTGDNVAGAEVSSSTDADELFDFSLLLLLNLLLLVSAAAVVVVIALVVVAVVGLLRSRLYLKVVVDSVVVCVAGSDAVAGVLIMRLRTLNTGRRDTLAAVAVALAETVGVAVKAAAVCCCVRNCQLRNDHSSRSRYRRFVKYIFGGT